MTAPARGAARRALRAALLLAPFVALVALAARPLAQTQAPAIARLPPTLDERAWDFADSPAGPTRVVVMTPRGAAPAGGWPVLVAFHGWGESVRGWARGAHGWSRDYELGATDAELRRRGLRPEAFLGFVAPGRYRALRRDLAARPYRGMVVVAPYTPDVLDGDAGDLSAAYGDWVADVALARVRRELPVASGREATGVDGVSLGGLLALELGLRRPDRFGVVGALQPAVRGRVERVLARWRPSPGRAQRVRLVASRGDRLTRDVEALDRAMTARGLAHELRLVEGPHDYVFNRGAGGVEMLLFHDRALRGLAAE